MASHSDQSFNSNNPFRRKSASPSNGAISPPPALAPAFDRSLDSTPRAPFAALKTALSQLETREAETEAGQRPGADQEAAPAELKPKKVVKRVRVQSPPPSSPEDAVPATRFRPGSRYSDEDEDDDDDDDDDNDDDAETSDSEDYERHIRGPFNTTIADDQDEDSYEHARTRPPANPFSKTLHDMEQTERGQGAGAPAASAAARGNLDVDSFKRLLLTGYANIPGPPPASASPGLGVSSRTSTTPQHALHDGASNTDASSVSRQSIFDAIAQETPRTSHETSEPEEPEERRSILSTSPLSLPAVPSSSSSSARKKPPPPSSRHGKLIKIELGADTDRRTATHLASSAFADTSISTIAPPRTSSSHSVTASPPQSFPTDVNKPLPQTPFRPTVEEAVDSPFDREAIGKVPEPFANVQTNPRPPTPPFTTRSRSESESSMQPRKPAAPPPRRHGRSDSRTPSLKNVNVDDDAPPRSSLESDRSRTDSIRTNNNNFNIPAPPPPRRPQHSRQRSSQATLGQGSLASAPVINAAAGESERLPIGSKPGFVNDYGQTEGSGGLATVTTGKDGTPKLSPPPPPPTRQASTRRPGSVRSMDLGNGLGIAKRVSKEKEGGFAPPPPPPPPPRQRGGSRTSV
ncbi:hypothetical protein GGS23DRAFT_565462, partial [Durotheca rogersii]|uniref:uncharacterized protein n=1 Tax=Durotheca rogersii TaxID=419775 RepID=UPI0022208095